jgi:hypothetical protein
MPSSVCTFQSRRPEDQLQSVPLLGKFAACALLLGDLARRGKNAHDAATGVAIHRCAAQHIDFIARCTSQCQRQIRYRTCGKDFDKTVQSSLRIDQTVSEVGADQLCLRHSGKLGCRQVAIHDGSARTHRDDRAGVRVDKAAAEIGFPAALPARGLRGVEHRTPALSRGHESTERTCRMQ